MLKKGKSQGQRIKYKEKKVFFILYFLIRKKIF